SLQR
ncbi:cobalamin-5-phosphate synthase family protein, partial [Vibrio parahaemolyticus V-223/04]